MLVAAMGLPVPTAIAREGRPLPKVGEVWMSTAEGAAFYREPFHKGLRDLVYIDGMNVTLLVHYAGGDPQRIPALVDQLIAADVDVMFLIAVAVPYAKQRTSTIPIVCAGFYDPVAEGLVESLAHPRGNITGLSWQSLESDGKRVELGTEILPGLSRIAIVFDDGEPGSVVQAQHAETVAQQFGLRVKLYPDPVRDSESVAKALSSLRRDRPQLLVVGDSSITVTHRKDFASFSIKARIPMISEGRAWAEAGAVVAYGPSGLDMFRRSAIYVAKILRGAKPGDLPIEQPTKFELLVNQSTANAIGLKIPEPILLRADEVID
jgi:putative tryptophan/tyrosine transport system substrate-binding protein